MEKLLFSIDLKIASIFAIIYLFIIPIFIFLLKKYRSITYLYFISFLILLSLGVFLDISIKNNICYFSFLITNKWFNNPLSIANFATFGVIVNLFLLFPLGFILPLIKPRLKVHNIILTGFFTSLLIEILQFILPIIRYPELLDILNNVISVILGYLYYLLLKKLLRGENNDRISKQKNH